MRRFTTVLGGLLAATLCGLSAANAADAAVPAPRHYVKAPEVQHCPCALEYPRHSYFTWRLSQWDPEYSNGFGHFAGIAPPPPPMAPEEWLNRPYHYWYR